MARITRRFFLLSSAALSAGCAVREPEAPATTSAPNIRQPTVDQSWRYAKHDLYTGTLLDTQVDHVAAIDGRVEINSMAEAAKNDKDSKRWGAEFLRKYIVRHDTAGGDLPSEIQEPWGMVLVDPHWNQVQVYEKPIPLWPEQLRPGWQTAISTKYKTPSNEEGLRWDQEMKAQDWETVTVPAGQFHTLRFTNVIKYRSYDLARSDCTRKETIWFAPEVGRWVARESSGSYYVEDSVIAQPYNENAFRWELLEWS